MKKYFYILGLSFIVSLILSLLAKEPIPEGDSYTYDMIGVNIAAGNGYKDENGELTMQREPIYPLFLSAVYKIFGHRYFPAQILQIILFLLTVILVYGIAEIIFDKQIALYSMAITAFFPTLINYPAYILSETLATFLLALFVYLCMKIYHKEKLKYYILAGAALGVLTLCKAMMMLFIFILLIWVTFICKTREINNRKILKAGIMALVYAVIVMSWMYRNYTVFGSFSLRQGLEGPLCSRAQRLDYDINAFKQRIVFIISEDLGKKIYPDAVDNPRDLLLKEDMLTRERILPELRRKGYSANEIKEMMMNEISKRPFKFIAISALDLFKMTQFTYLPLLVYEKNLITKIINLPNGRLILSLARGVFRLFAYLLILLSFIGIAIKKRSWRKWSLLLFIICYINLLYSLIAGHGRYGVPLIPYYVMFSVPFILMIREKMKGMIKCQK